MSTASEPSIQSPARTSRVELILKQIEQLPTLPAVAMRVLQVTSSEASTVADVAALIETDPALTTKVLGLVRSASVAARDVTTVERAIVLLGFEAVRSAVLSVQVYETFKKAEPDVETPFDRAEFWKHSLAVACAARLIAAELHLRKQEGEAFVCGLLHDMGKIALEASLPKSYARVVRQTHSTRRCLCDVERELIGVDHTVAGKRLAVRWKLPRSIVECIWLHHQPLDALPESLAAGLLVRIVHLADDLVRQQRIGYSGYNRVDPPETSARALGLSPKALEKVLEALPLEIEKNCQLVGIDDLSGTALYAKALAEANAELGRVNATLSETNRRLAVRARCFEGLCRFTRSLGLDDSVSDVCRAAARCFREVLGIAAAVGFHCAPDCSFYHFGVSGPDGDSADTLDASARNSSLRGGAARSASIAGPIGPAPAMAEPVIAQCEATLGFGTMRMLAISHAGLVIGGVIFSCEGDTADMTSVSAEEFEALSVAFGLAVSGAADRARSDQLSEEMAFAGRQLHQAQGERLRTRAIASIAEVAAGAAHELNSPLAVIAGRAQMLADGPCDPEQGKAARIIQDHAQQASDIVSELVRFAKPEPPQPGEIRLAPWLQAVRRRWLERSSLRSGQLEVTLSDAELSVFSDPDQLQRVFDALLANAVEATTPDSARVHINSASLSSDDRIVVTVTDNGAGMTTEVLQHAADPFFSHRTAGRGRGMGLSHAVRLTANNGGRLWLESTPGAGTTAHVELPARRMDPA